MRRPLLAASMSLAAIPALAELDRGTYCTAHGGEYATFSVKDDRLNTWEGSCVIDGVTRERQNGVLEIRLTQCWFEGMEMPDMTRTFYKTDDGALIMSIGGGRGAGGFVVGRPCE